MVLSHERGQPPPKATKTRCEGPWLGNCHRSKASEGAGLEGWRGKNSAFCSVAWRLMQTASVLFECSNAFQHSAELFKNGSSITKQMARVLFSIPMELLANYGLKAYNDARTPSTWKLSIFLIRVNTVQSFSHLLFHISDRPAIWRGAVSAQSLSALHV